jgi:glycosyltransferase involved in cell wall biosynthesis
MGKIALSIVIPTRNRPETLRFALESIKLCLSEIDYEIIIASNGESLEADLLDVRPELLEFAQVVRNERRLSLSDNWRFGFGFTKGKWVHILGDDDCIAIKHSEKLKEILKREDVDGLVFRYGTFNWKVDQKGDYSQEYIWQPNETRETQKIKSNASVIRNWESLQPRDYPNTTGRSLVKRDYLSDLEEKGLLFAAASPDWFTGAYFAFSNSTFLRCDLIWANIGVHPKSSLFQMKNPGTTFSLGEAKLQSYGFHQKLSSKNGQFPTTWLVRMDSIIRAREALSLNTKISEFRLLRQALETTPRFVWRVSKQLVSDKPLRIFLVTLIGFYEQVLSLLRWSRRYVRTLSIT